MLRAIREIKPKYVVGENVRGIISWNGGLVFDEVQADLEAEGYTVIPCILPACGVNAPHRRERVWFVAYRECGGRKTMCGVQHKESVGKMFSDNGERGTTSNTDNARNTASRSGIVGDWTENIIERELAQSEFDRYADAPYTESKRGERLPFGKEEKYSLDGSLSSNGDVTDTSSLRLCECENTRSMGKGQSEICGEGDKLTDAIETSSGFRDAANAGSGGRIQNDIEQQADEFKHAHPRWDFFPTQPPICGGNDELPRELDGITFPKWRSESIKAYGNAIVPAVAFEIFKVINEIDNFLNENSYLL